jgi:hypothetical protein
MIGSPTRLSTDVRLLLDRERQIAVLPAAARARALFRARSALAAGVATRQSPSRAPSALRWAAAAGLACVATVAAAAVAYTVGVRARPTAPSVAAAAPTAPPASHWSAGDEPFRDLLARPVVPAAGARATAGARVELRLLEQARAAVATEDFAAAMQLLADHARRFRRGRLVEEREALRVQALAGLGRRSDARRAAAQFEAKFPRSPLLPAVTEMPDLAP